MRMFIRTGALLAVVVMMAGCPIPLPSGYTASSRENISAGMTVQLEAGVTTREEVLLLLGEPDGTGPDDAWLAYGSVYGEGGVVFVLCAGGGCGGAGSEKMEYRRLVVTFDEHGLMINAEFVNRECWEGIIGMGSAGGRSPPCLLISTPNDTQATPVGEAPDTVPPGGEMLIPYDLREFASGKAVLVTPGWISGFEAATAAGENSRLTRELHDRGQWQELARTVINDKYGDDLRWYYLGRAAEGMGLCDTAEVYYGISKERSDRFITHCMGIACSGISVPNALESRLRAVKAMRAAGTCSTEN
jgi:outer membrane protein assembly factor BamE (lipoprotein component of BamABCDE complex)